ncbi:MAG TPA: hypothetical protein VN806_03665 [Caulobacteraceae bacterium]|nr:hypothetical protein [Caulobacteraceae bacterium]
MYAKRLAETIRAVLPLTAAACAAAGLGGCDTLARNNYFLPGGIDQRSAVAAQVGAAEHEQGPFPQFAEIPAQPTDVRPLAAWRATVGDVAAQKVATDTEIREHPFTLEGTEDFADAARAKIPPEEAIPPTDATAEAEAFAASLGARAKTPPPHR